MSLWNSPPYEHKVSVKVGLNVDAGILETSLRPECLSKAAEGTINDYGKYGKV